jgi:hypothetical protein
VVPSVLHPALLRDGRIFFICLEDVNVSSL